MIRIIYSWEVPSDKLELFIESWKSTTNKIHETVRGARGSFMLQDHQKNSAIKTIAKWDSLDDWKNFWQNSNPKEMHNMHQLGKRISVEVFKEIGDFSK